MEQWHDFVLATSAAAGVLTGLVFVGVSINLEKIVSQSDSGLPGRAAEALIMLLAVLTASILLLVPGQSVSLMGMEVLVVGVAAYAWIVTIQALHLRNLSTIPSYLRKPLLLRITFAQIATLPNVIAGIALLTVGFGGLYWLVAGMVLSTLAAMFDAWVLLVEINR
jgi:modulator of FtsH protease